jgi:hypothetical protein
MSDPHDDNHHSFPIYTIHYPVVTDSNSKMVRLCFELLAARRKRISAERGNLLADTPLKSPVEGPELSRRGRREFENVAHVR